MTRILFYNILETNKFFKHEKTNFNVCNPFWIGDNEC